MEPPSIDLLETPENYVANMKFHNESDIAERIIQLSIVNGFLNEAFALQLIEANPNCYELFADPQWEDLKNNRNISLFAVQKDDSNLVFVPDELKDDDFFVDAFGHDVRRLDEHLPHWRTDLMLIRRIYELNPNILNEIDSTLYDDVTDVNIVFPRWKTDLKLIKHILKWNPELFNELDPSMYNNPELFEFVRQKKIPLCVLNKGIPQQEQFKARMRDLVSLALTQRRPWNIGKMGYGEALTMQRNLGGPTYKRRGTIGGKRRKKTKRRTYGSAPPL
jgi:hypothetical protein